MPKHVAEGVISSAPVVITDATGTTDAINVRTLSRAGFPNRTDSVLSYDSGTRTVTLTPTGTTFQYWVANQRYTTGAISVTHGTAPGEYFILFNSAGVLTASSSPWDLTSDQNAAVAECYWDGGTQGTCAEERHSCYIDRLNHAYLHNTRGTAYGNGLDTTFPTSATFSTNAGTIWDEDIKIDITGTQTACRLWYQVSGTGGLSMSYDASSSFPYKHITGTLQWDNSGVLNPVTNGNYVSSWVYATDELYRPVSIVVGQRQFTSLAAAASDPLPTFPNRTLREWKLLYQAIFRYQGGVISFQSATDYRNAAVLQGAAAASSMPASAVTYVPSVVLSSTNVQSAITEIADRLQPAFGGMYLDPGVASSGGVGDPSGSLTSGTWTVISASGLLSASRSSSNGYVSASLSNGRIYIGDNGGFFNISAQLSCETSVTTNAVHFGVFITGTEYPRFTQVQDMANDQTHELIVQALTYLPSGSYIDARVRAGNDVPIFTTHHFYMSAIRLAPSGS